MVIHLPYNGAFRVTKLYGTSPPVGMTYAAGKHMGLDLVGIDDCDIRALCAGTVLRSGLDPDGWGNYIAVKQDDGYIAIYCHLKSRQKTAGQHVAAGDWLGVEGASGKVTGQHLHLEIRRDYADKFSTVNPADYLDLANELGVAKLTVIRKKLDLVLPAGKSISVAAIEEDNINYVPIRQLLEALALKLELKDGKIVISKK